MPSKNFRGWMMVERENAVRYLVTSLISFVATVILVRSFLVLTGYPQIGSGTLHIAHVLWGGLILYIAALLPLIYLDPQLHGIGAVLSGVGVGLFIDEVGKFITRQYDYFFPAAAPIMYVFFLLLVILLVMIRRPRPMDGRAELVRALEMVREQLYRPLEAQERKHIQTDLENVIQGDQDGLHRDMARHLLEFIQADTRPVVQIVPAWWLRIAVRMERWLSEKKLRLFSGIGMLLLGLLTLKNPLQVLLDHSMPNSALVNFLNTHAGRQIAPVDAPLLFNIRLGLEVLIGAGLIVAALLLAVRKRRQAFVLAYFSLLASLAVLDMLLFYFEQFSTAATVMFQFLLLFGVMQYRRRFLKSRT